MAGTTIRAGGYEREQRPSSDSLGEDLHLGVGLIVRTINSAAR
jgi:hypothetical protein